MDHFGGTRCQKPRRVTPRARDPCCVRDVYGIANKDRGLGSQKTGWRTLHGLLSSSSP